MSGLQYYATAYNWCSPRYLDHMIHKDISALAFAMKKENLYSGQFFIYIPQSLSYCIFSYFVAVC